MINIPGRKPKEPKTEYSPDDFLPSIPRERKNPSRKNHLARPKCTPDEYKERVQLLVDMLLELGSDKAKKKFHELFQLSNESNKIYLRKAREYILKTIGKSKDDHIRQCYDIIMNQINKDTAKIADVLKGVDLLMRLLGCCSPIILSHQVATPPVFHSDAQRQLLEGMVKDKRILPHMPCDIEDLQSK